MLASGREILRHQRAHDMDQQDVQRLEEACERAMAEVLRKHYSTTVNSRVCHLMAKAAVTVLEAVTEAEAKK
jgi:hypothetical protein